MSLNLTRQSSLTLAGSGDNHDFIRAYREEAWQVFE